MLHDWLNEGVDPDDGPDDWECCPVCWGEGWVLSARPGYLLVCPTCRGEGTVDIEPSPGPYPFSDRPQDGV